MDRPNDTPLVPWMLSFLGPHRGRVATLATSAITLVVMFSILAYKDLTMALLSLVVVPFLFLCLRYYTATLSNREERVKELESKLLERLYETFSAMRLVKSFAREPYET